MSSNKTIAKNTLFLYLRMLITTVVSLFTSRIVIDALGFADYGLYSVVGGITGMIAFMHTSLAGATIRFMNIEIGKANIENLKSVFNSALIIHFSLALLVFVIAETFGLWFLYQKLNVEPGRFNAAFWVYQFSVISVLMGVIQIPYDAAIIAHQKMSIYAYISILESVLKLFIAYAVYISPFDKLIVYAALVLLVSIIIRTIYQIYCVRNFKECSFKWKINKDYIKSISSFFGWDLFGNFSVVAKNQGMQIIQNIFFGSIINAAVGIANTLSGIVTGFASNFSVAAKPQIVQYYSQGKIEKMLSLMYFNTRATFFLMFCFCIPFFLQPKFLIKLWLIDIPDYTITFTQLIIFQIAFSRLYTPINDVIHATGNIKLWSFISGLVNILNVILSYSVLKLHSNPVYPFFVGIFCLFISYCINVIFIKRYIKEFSVKHFVVNICLKNVCVVILSISPAFFMKNYMDDSVFMSVLNLFLGFLIYFISVFVFGLKPNEREFIIVKLKLTKFYKSNV